MNTFLAKSDGTTLKEHSLSVYKFAMRILDDAGCYDDRIRNAVGLTALFHDIGKCEDKFQTYLKHPTEENKNKVIPHNILGSYLFQDIINIDSRRDEFAIFNAIRNTHISYDEYINWDDTSFNGKKRDISDVVAFILDLFESANFSEFHIKETCEVLTDSNVPSIAYADTCVGGQISALRTYDICHSIVRYADYWVSNGIEYRSYERNKTLSELVIPIEFDKQRWDEQTNHIREIINSGKNLAKLHAPTGYGKTVMGLQWIIGNQGKKCYWVLPDNNLAEEIFSNICKTLKLCNYTDLKVSLLLASTYDPRGSEDDGDIIVTNIDNYTNSIFKNSAKTYSADRMLANVIFDEYHKYFVPNPLMVTFEMAYRSRMEFSNVKTLLMSATPVENRFFAENGDCFIYPSTGVLESKMLDNKVEISFIDDFIDAESLNIPDKGGLVVSTSVKRCQEFDLPIYFHSRFFDEDKSKIVDRIKSSNDSISASPIITEGYDFEREKLWMIDLTPEGTIQAIGRINRFNIDRVSYICAIKSKKLLDTGIYKNFKEKTSPYWDYVSNWYSFLKDNKDKIRTKRDLYKLREEYCGTEIARLAVLFMRSSIEQFSKIEFKYGGSLKTGDEKKLSRISKGDTLRGNNDSIYINIQNENGEWGVTPMVISRHQDKSWENELGFPDDGKSYNHEVCKYYKDKEDKRKLKNYEKWSSNKLFNYQITRATNPETPFICVQSLDLCYTTNKGLMRKFL